VAGLRRHGNDLSPDAALLTSYHLMPREGPHRDAIRQHVVLIDLTQNLTAATASSTTSNKARA
jgi:hypothetical protein